MPALAWNGLKVTVKIPAGGTNSEPFATPAKLFGFTVHIPALDGATPTLKMQALDPNDGTWRDLYSMPTGGAPGPVTGLPSNSAVSVSAPVSGLGVVRFVASAAQNSDKTITVFFGMR